MSQRLGRRLVVVLRRSGADRAGRRNSSSTVVPSGRRHLVRSTNPDSTGYRMEKSYSSASASSRAMRCFSVPPRSPGGPCSSCSTWGRLVVALEQAELERRERHGQRLVGLLAAVGLAEERVALVHARATPRAIRSCPLVGEGDAAVVVDEGRVLDEVAQPVAGGPQAEVDLLAVAAPERLLVEEAAPVERVAGDVHAEADPGDDLGTHRRPSGGPRTRRTRRCEASSPSRSKASMIERGKVQIDPKLVSGVTVATSVGAGRVDETVEPALGHDGVGVEHHHVAAAGPEPFVHRLHEPEVRVVVHHPHRHRVLPHRHLVEIGPQRRVR